MSAQAGSNLNTVSMTHTSKLENIKEVPLQHRKKRIAAKFDIHEKQDVAKDKSVLPEKGNIEQECVTVCQLQSVSQFSLEVQVAEKTVDAVVDSGAQVSIISEKLYNSLQNPPKKLRMVKLQTAGKQLSMQGFIAGPVKIKIGDQWYTEEIHVAPIQQDMLLGFDILVHRGKSIIDMAQGTLMFDGQILHLNMEDSHGAPHIAKVTVIKRQVIPPNSVVRVKCHLQREMPDYIIEPVEDAKMLIPKILRAAGTDPVLCVLNPTDRYRLLKKGSQIAKAYPIVEIMADDTQGADEIRAAQVETNTNFSHEAKMPEHLQKLYEESKEHLSEDQCNKLAQLLIEFQDVFAKSEFDLGTFHDIQHGIDTGDARPVKQRMRRTPACFKGEEEAHLKKMLEAGVIRESTSEWASAPVLIRKRDGSVRWCIDYRALNEVTVKDVFPLPLVDDCLDTLAGSMWFSKLDANSAYWQVEIKEEDRKKTAFITKYGLFEHTKMGFGLCNAPATFARVMNLVLRGLTWKTVLAFLDDILVLGGSFEEHLQNLAEVFLRLREYGLKLKPKKCLLFHQEVEFLGRMVSSNKLAMSSQNVQVIHDWPVPTCSKDVERFLGLANYHRSFVKDFSKRAEPLYRLVGKGKFQWTDREQEAFEDLKRALSEPPVLALLNNHDSFILDTDSSDTAIGAELIQVQNDLEKVIAYGSFALTPDQRRYCTTRKELLAIVRFTRQYRYYLLGRPFTVRTDHASLTWLLRFKNPEGQLARWMEELSQYNMILKHRPGAKHGNADALSRIPGSREYCEAFKLGVKPSDLPCGGCDYCTRADRNWGSFARVVNCTVTMASQGVHHIIGTDDECTNSDATGDSKLGDQENVGLSPVNVDAPLKRHSFSNLGKEVLVPESSTGFNSSCRSEKLGKNDQETSHRMIAMEQQEPGECEFGLSQGSQQLQVTGNSPHEEVIELPLDAKKGETRSKTMHVGILSVEGSVEITTKVVNAIITDEPSCWGFSLNDLREQQSKDADLSIVLDWLADAVEPGEGELFLAGPAAKAYWLNKEQFTLIDGVLYRNRDDCDEKDLVIPRGLRAEAIRLSHDLPSTGHQGVARTKARMKEMFYWYGMGKAVAEYVASCDVCSRSKKTDKYGRTPMKEYQAGAPMERVHIDFLGPLPKTPRGNEHILMMVDQFTKWVECVPLPSQTAEVTAKAAVDNFFSRFGCPFQIFSDQGRNFESKLFTALCDALRIHKSRTTPYRPSANGQAERYNRSLMDAIRCFIGKSQNQWDLHLQQIAGALRSSVNRSTGYTANRLMLGREINLPAHLMFPHPATKTTDVNEYVAKLTSSIQKAHDTARKTLKTSLHRMKRDYDLRVLERSYEEGDLVYLLDTASIKGKCRKLSPPWKGPAVITKKVSASLFRVKMKNAIFVVNHDRLKPCRDRKVPAWIMKWKSSPDVGVLPDEGDDEAYCLCRTPWQGRFMIQCDYCDEWYHGSCVNITATDALEIDRYKCCLCKNKPS